VISFQKGPEMDAGLFDFLARADAFDNPDKNPHSSFSV
jgi:hypothetical protein